MAQNVSVTAAYKTMAWEKLLTECLIKDELINGSLLLSSTGEVVHKCGVLYNIDKESYSQFIGLFENSDDERDAELFQSGLKMLLPVIEEGSFQTIRFRILRKTPYSLLATSSQNRCGLVVVNLSFGILIASHSHPVTSFVAYKAVRHFADLLNQ